MLSSKTFLFGAVIGLAAAPYLAAATPASADPAYNSDKVVDLFLKDKAATGDYKAKVKTRGICIGTAAECPTPKAPAQAHFDLLVSFDLDALAATAAGAGIGLEKTLAGIS